MGDGGDNAANPPGHTTVRPPVASWVKSNCRIWPGVHPDKVDPVIFPVRDPITNVVTVPAEELVQVKVGVALNETEIMFPGFAIPAPAPPSKTKTPPTHP